MKNTYLKLAFILLLILSLKAMYSVATLEQLRYFMYPMVPIIEIFTQTTFTWIPEIGYYSPLEIVIEKSCAGGNFFIICFAFLCFKLWNYSNLIQFSFRIFCLGMLSYFLMIFANTTRIVSAMKLAEWEFTQNYIDPKTAHLALGSILYMLTLLFINHFITSTHGKIQAT